MSTAPKDNVLISELPKYVRKLFQEFLNVTQRFVSPDCEFETGVLTGDAVFYDSVSGLYRRSLSGLEARDKFSGIADVERKTVTHLGAFTLQNLNFPIGSGVYVSEDYEGHLTTTSTTLPVGYVVLNDLLMISPIATSDTEYLQQFEQVLASAQAAQQAATTKAQESQNSAVLAQAAAEAAQEAASDTHVQGLIDSSVGSINYSNRKLLGRLQDVFSVKDFLAKGDGVTDDSGAFGLAARSVPVKEQIFGTIRIADMAEVLVPPGVYLLSSLVDVGGRDITWVASAGTTFINPQNLNGRLSKPGKTYSSPYGVKNGLATQSVRMGYGENPDFDAEVLGLVDDSGLSTYVDRDAVAVYYDVVSMPPLATLVTPSYTVDKVIPTTPLSASVLKRLRRGMIIDTGHTPACSGIITSWAADGTSITVSGWFPKVHTAAEPITPSWGATAYVNSFTKLWTQNSNLFLTAEGHASDGTGYELGLVDAKNPNGQSKLVGFDAVNLDPLQRPIRAFHMARGAGQAGYRADGPEFALYAINCGMAVNSLNDNGSGVNILSDGKMDLTSDGAWYQDIKRLGGNYDYDFRIFVGLDGEPATKGYATTTFSAGRFFFDAEYIAPQTDSESACGLPTSRWDFVCAASGTINTSDEDVKQDIEAIPDDWLDAWAEVQFVRFKFKSAVVKKADGARWHVGLIAQRVKTAFESRGIDPFAIGLLCYDEWEAQEAVTLEKNGEVQEISPARPAGHLYGIRYEEALCLESALLRRTTVRLESRLQALEG